MSKKFKKVPDGTQLSILKAIAVKRVMQEPIVLAEIGSSIKSLAVELDIEPKILASVLVPIYKKAVALALTPGALKKSAKRGHHRHCH